MSQNTAGTTPNTNQVGDQTLQIPEKNQVATTTLTNFLTHIQPPGSYGTWKEVADDLYNNAHCLTSIGTLATKYQNNFPIDPILIGLDYNNNWVLYDGTHRLLAAVAANKTITYTTTEPDNIAILWYHIKDLRLTEEHHMDILHDLLHSLPLPDNSWANLEYLSVTAPKNQTPQAELGVNYSGNITRENACEYILQLLARHGYQGQPAEDPNEQ